MPELAIIIVTWNSHKFIRRCLCSLLDGTKYIDSPEIMVLDNNSSDNTTEIVQSEFPTIRLIKNSSNIGLSAAINQCLQKISAYYYLILNPDVEIYSDAMSTLLKYIKSEVKIGMVGPKIVYPDGRLQYSCREFPSLRAIITRGFGMMEQTTWMPKYLHRYLMTDFDHKSSREVDWVLGACLLIRREVVESIGYFDERFSLYYGDVDFCWRAWQKGWKVAYVPEAVVMHDYQRQSARGGIFNPLKWSHAKSSLRFVAKRKLYELGLINL